MVEDSLKYNEYKNNEMIASISLNVIWWWLGENDGCVISHDPVRGDFMPIKP